MLQNIEVISTPNSNYLLIHKNGCSQVKEHFYENFDQVETYDSFPQNNKVNWTVLRDPYDRFISGLTYDILKQFQSLDNLNEIINISSLSFYQKVNLKTRKKGNVSHIIPQWTYLFSQPLDFLVKIKDLNNFLDLHFQKRVNFIESNTPLKQKNIVLDYIEKNSDFKNLIMAYLSPDYYYIQQMESKGVFWTWQTGKIF